MLTSTPTIGAGEGWEVQRGDAIHLLQLVAPESVDLVHADLPYSSGGLYRGDRTKSTASKYCGADLAPFQGDAKDQRSFEFWCTMWMSLALERLKHSGYLLAWTDHRQLGAVQNAMQAAGAIYRGIVTWDKVTCRPPSPAWFIAQAEFVVWGTRGDAPSDGKGPFPGVLRCPAVHHSIRLHPCEKPQTVLRELLGPVRGGGHVLDPFAGCASAGVAALSVGATYLGMELDEGYAGVATDHLAGVPREEIRARIAA